MHRLFHETRIWNSNCLCFYAGKERLRSGGRVCVSSQLPDLLGLTCCSTPWTTLGPVCRGQGAHLGLPLQPGPKIVTKPNSGLLTPAQQSQSADMRRGEGRCRVYCRHQARSPGSSCSKDPPPNSLVAFRERLLKTEGGREGGWGSHQRVSEPKVGSVNTYTPTHHTCPRAHTAHTPQ